MNQEIIYQISRKELLLLSITSGGIGVVFSALFAFPFTKNTAVSFPIIMLSIIFFRPWGYISFILLILLGSCSYLKYMDAGWSIDSDQLTLQYRHLTKNTVFMLKKKIQIVRMEEGVFQRKHNLATVNTVVKSGVGNSGGLVVDLNNVDVEKIYWWFSKSKQKLEKNPIKKV